MWPRIACSLSKSGITKRPDSAPAVSWGPRGNEVPDRREHERLGLKKWQSLDVRDELERAVSLESDDGKVPPVSREHGADVLALGEVGQPGIGELQASGFVAIHHGCNGGQIVVGEKQQSEAPAVNLWNILATVSGRLRRSQAVSVTTGQQVKSGGTKAVKAIRR